MPYMNQIDHLNLDGHLLKLLLVVHEEGSVTGAAQRLGLTQSAVSHGLDRLRAIVGDALFVRSGRGITATPVAGVLALRAAALLDELQAFSRTAGFEPQHLNLTLTVAANDLQRDLLLPGLLRRLRAQAPGLTLQVLPSGAPDAALLREQGCELLITPRPPQGSDIFQKRLFEDGYRVYFDARQRQAPASRAEYLGAEHVTVVYPPRRPLAVDEWLAARGLQRHFVASVPGLAGLAAMLQGSPWLATAPALLAAGALRGLASAEVPVATPGLPMYMVWHRRHQADPVQRWVRDALEAEVAAVLAGARG